MVIISQANITGAAFRFTGLSLPLSLDKGESVTFSVGFSPNAEGRASGGISLDSNASNPNLTIPLSGTGISAVQLTPSATDLNFGSVTDGILNAISLAVPPLPDDPSLGPGLLTLGNLSVYPLPS